MSFNNGNERRKLNAKWEQLRVQYRDCLLYTSPSPRDTR